MIDLHAHTTASDGTCSPAQLVEEAVNCGLEALAITDHDTFAGYDEALPLARNAGLELVCGVELSTKLGKQSVHLLGYFFAESSMGELREFVLDMQGSRRERNQRLSAHLKEFGIDIAISEVEALGHGYAGRPHYAQLLVEKGYVSTLQQAFDEYLDESAKGYVDRREAQLIDCVQMIRRAGGIACLAHPKRLRAALSQLLPQLTTAGLNAIEVYYSEHTPDETEHYLALASQHRLLITGGSDFHGALKPTFRLGTGVNENLSIPRAVLDQLKFGRSNYQPPLLARDTRSLGTTGV